MNQMMRLWNVKKKCWLGDMKGIKLGRIIKNIMGIPHFALEDLLRLDYIRMDDINQTPIFEEDIVRVRFEKDREEDLLDEECITGIIKYVAPSYVIVTYNDIYNFSSSTELEVIGSLRKNPERFVPQNRSGKLKCV